MKLKFEDADITTYNDQWSAQRCKFYVILEFLTIATIIYQSQKFRDPLRSYIGRMWLKKLQTTVQLVKSCFSSIQYSDT